MIAGLIILAFVLIILGFMNMRGRVYFDVIGLILMAIGFILLAYLVIFLLFVGKLSKGEQSKLIEGLETKHKLVNSL